MKTCRDIAELASEYVDGELPLVTWGEVRMHLWMCPPCRAYVAQIRMTRELLEALPTDEVPRAVHEELLARYRQWVAEGKPGEEE